MTPADLDALIEQFPEIHPGNYGEEDAIALNNWGIDAVAALVQLRDSEALARGKIAEQMIEIAQHERAAEAYTESASIATLAWEKRCQRAEAEVARLKDLVTETCVKELAQMTRAHDAELRIAALEAERDALKQDAERWQAVLKSRFMLCDFDVRESGHFRTTKLRLVDAVIDAAKEKP